MFAKLYEMDNGEQVLAKLDSDDDNNPELRFYVEPPGLGVCSIAAKWDDTKRGWDDAQEAFEKVTRDSAVKMAERILDSTKEMQSGE